MTAEEIRFLYLFAGCPRMAASKVFTDYDRRVCEQIVAHLGWLPDDEDRERDDVLEDDMVKQSTKYGEVWGS